MNRLPSLFVSHGAPTWAIEPGVAGPLLAQVGASLPRPEAVLVLSPHWMTREMTVSSAAQPRTIHDFGGFPEVLYGLQYPAPGHPRLASLAAETLSVAGFATSIDERRGLDHGAWVPMRYLYPAATVPVFQVSMPATLDASSAWRMGEALAPLSEEGILIVGSGSLTHNLREFRLDHEREEPYAVDFVTWVRETVVAGDRERLLHTLDLAPNAARAHPTTEHFLPLLVARAAAPDGAVSVLPGGITHGVLSMESYVFGASDPAGARGIPEPFSTTSPMKR